MKGELNKDYEKKIDDIYTAIVGNEGTGVRGLASRVKSLEEYKRKDQRIKNKVVGGLMVGTPILVVIWDYLVESFKDLANLFHHH